MRSAVDWVWENSLSLALFALFVVCFALQTVAGWELQNQTLALHHRAAVDYWGYLTSGTYVEGLSSNWQAAFLQLSSLILFSLVLYQRGAPHSRDPKKRRRRTRRRAGRLAGWFGWIYAHSLLLTMLALFVISMGLHAVSGAADENSTRALFGQKPLSVLEFLDSAKFWSVTLQTWQAEYLAIVMYIVLSIFLRQEGSPESKPVASGHDTTGVVDDD